MLALIIVIGAVLFLSKSTKAIIPVGTRKVEHLAPVGTPTGASSTPVPTPSNNSPTSTPPFFQQSNAATPSEPITTVSFDPINITSPSPASGTQDRQGTLADSIRTPTLHNNVIINNTLNEKLSLIQRPLSKSEYFIPDTELSSISEEQTNAYEKYNGTPVNPEASRPLTWGATNIKNAGGSNGTHPATPHAGILQYAHRLAPAPQKQTSIEKTIPHIASRVLKSSLKPSGKVTHPNTNFFRPIDRVR